MALPSQMQSNPGRGRHVYRRKKRRRGPVVLVVLAVLGIGLWIILSLSDSSSSAPETTSAAATAPEVSPPPAEDSSVSFRRGVPPSPPLAPANSPSEPQWTLEPPQKSSAASANPTSATTTSVPPASAPTALSPALDAPGGPLVAGRQLVEEGQLVQARLVLSQALASEALNPSERTQARGLLELINDELLFSSRVYPGDPWAMEYEVRPGDSLSRIVSRQKLEVDWRFLQRINAINRPEAVRSGQSLKVVKGPFHAEVDKTDHRLDLYLGEGPERVFVRSFQVGLGELGSTPLGRYRVQKGRKLVNPTWTNPRTGEFFPSDDPNNPIGEYWVGLQGIDEVNRDERGFGIHGTIEPETIGTDSSMGCIRLREGEIDVIYAAMAEGSSTVNVRP